MNSRNGSKRKPVAIAVGGGVLLVALVIILLITVGSRDAGAELPTFVVREGPLEISVTEAGTIRASDQRVLKNEVEGSTTILFLIEEGTQVEPGQLLVELDASKLKDALVEQKIRVQNAEATFIRARENMAVSENQATSDISRAELDLRFAREDLLQYLDGEFPKQQKEAEARITLRSEEMKQAEDTLEWSEKLFLEKYISQNEVERDRLARQRASLDHELAQADLDLLLNFTLGRRKAELQSDIDQAVLALERVTRKAKADVVQAEADLNAKEAELTQQKDKYTKLEGQIEKTRITAPVAGMVVYATTGRGGWRGNDEPLDEGQAIRERQELIHLPTTDSMSVEVKIHESNLDKVRRDQATRITVDAAPGKAYWGRVTRISPLPDATSVWLNPDLKVYSTRIEITSGAEGLRTGMSCRVEIIVERYDSAVYVPIQAIVRRDGAPTAYVLDGNDAKPREVKIGLDNNRMVRIVEGLEPGEKVLLSPPLSTGTEVIAPASREEPPENLKAPLEGKNGAGTTSSAPEEAVAESGELTWEKLKAMSESERADTMKSVMMDPEKRKSALAFVRTLSAAQREELGLDFGRGGQRPGGGRDGGGPRGDATR